MNIPIEMDLFRDLVEHVRHRLVEAGYNVPSTYDQRDILYAWANVRNRIPSARPRRTHRSREFFCAPQYLPGLALVERKLEGGETIRPHLSRKVFELDFHDALLNDWGIQHLHLGTATMANGLAVGTRDVVFCIFTPDDVYLIQIMDHHKFSEPNLLEIVNQNWPHLLQRLPLAQGKRQSSDDIGKMRKAGVLALMPLADGTVVAPRGGGYSSTGHSLQAMISANHWVSLTDRWEQIVRQFADKVVEDARQRGVSIPSKIKFELWEDNSQWFAVAPELETTMRLPT